MKRFFTTISALLLCAYSFAYDFYCDGIYYNILSEKDKTCEVTFKESEYKESQYGGYYVTKPTPEYTGDITIPATANGYSVTSIGEDAFEDCSSLTSIDMPNVTSIGYYAFYGCYSLTSIDMPNVTSIGNFAFDGCSSLTSIDMPNVTSIGNAAFWVCSSLTSIDMPNVTSIGNDAFMDCSSLTSIDMPNVTSIGNDAFMDCSSLTSIDMPNVTSIGNYAFGDCSSLTSIDMPNVTSIGNDAFMDCYSLTSIDMPNVTSIGNYAFSHCTSLTSIDMPNVTSIGNYAFERCDNLKYVSIANSNSLSIGSNAFIPTCHFFYNSSLSKDLSLSAHYNHKDCTPEEIGDYLISVHKDGSKHVCDYYGEQTDITLPAVDGVEDYAFGRRTDITSIVMPNSIKAIGDFSFVGLNLSNVVFSENLLSIGNNAFLNCQNIKNLNIPNKVTTIGASAFNGCSGVEELHIPTSLEEISTFTFADMSSLTYVRVPESVKTIKYAAFYNCNSIERIDLSNNITEIESKVFYNCFSLKEIILPSGIKSIDESTFYSCSKLENVTLNGSLESIGSSAFSYCKNLESIELPDGLTDIGSYAFAYSGLTSIVLPNSINTLGSNAFSCCENLESIELPDGIESVPYGCFSYCTNLSSITLSKNITIISRNAFSGCKSLTSIDIPANVTSIEDQSFKGCTSLVNITNYATTPQRITSTTFEPQGILHVLAGCGDTYRATTYWRDFLIKEDAVLPIEEDNADTYTIADGDVYSSNTITHASRLKYSRQFNNTSWQALYVPFSIDYADYSSELEIARLHDVHMYDDNGDDEPDRTMLEFYILHDGSTKPNTPYLVRAKNTGKFDLTLNNVDIEPAVCNPFECSSFVQTFVVRGTYSGVSGTDMVANHYYAPANGKLSYANNTGANLKPQRWYLKVTNKDGSEVTNLAPSIRMCIDGEPIGEEETCIETIETKANVNYYTIDGRAVSTHKNGLYVRNNKKVLVR